MQEEKPRVGSHPNLVHPCRVCPPPLPMCQGFQSSLPCLWEKLQGTVTETETLHLHPYARLMWCAVLMFDGTSLTHAKGYMQTISCSAQHNSWLGNILLSMDLGFRHNVKLYNLLCRQTRAGLNLVQFVSLCLCSIYWLMFASCTPVWFAIIPYLINHGLLWLE